jgi:hypothetical protein
MDMVAIAMTTMWSADTSGGVCERLREMPFRRSSRRVSLSTVFALARPENARPPRQADEEIGKRSDHLSVTEAT